MNMKKELDAAMGLKESPQGDGEETGVCVVCSDDASGKHYGVLTCNGCKGFFRRSVRAERPYVCRADNDCPVHKLARNACRACRFKRCLDVGMDVESIRPDRDKIGKRGSSQMSSQPSASSLDDLIASVQSAKRKPSLETITPLFTKSPASTQAITQDAAHLDILQSLQQCARAISSLSSSALASGPSSSTSSLADVFTDPTIISPRIPFVSSGGGGIATPSDLALNVRVLLTQLVDWVTRVPPLSDFPQEEKMACVRSVAPAFILFSILRHSTQSEAPALSLLLPLGQVITRDISFLPSEDDGDCKANVGLQMRINSVKKDIFNHLLPAFTQTGLSCTEETALRVLLLLDMCSPLTEVQRVLSTAARESITEALHAHCEEEYRPMGITRFSHLLLLLAAIHRHAAAAVSALQRCKDLGMGIDPIIDQFLLHLL